MEEEWRSVKGYEGLYEVSSHGRVKSLERKNVLNEKILKPSSIGYVGGKRQKVSLCKDNKIETKKIHQLVAEAFIGPRPDGLVTDHIDNDPFNNHADNLQYITQRLNTSKDKKNGTSPFIGVSWYDPSRKWCARINVEGKRIHLGYFNDELEAAIAYQIALTGV